MNMDHGQTVVQAEREYNSSFHKLLKMFTISILISFIGTAVGQFLPIGIILPLIFVEFIMLISAFMVRRKGKSIGYTFVFTFCFISGITIYPSVMYYANAGGTALVNTAFILTVAMFAGLTLYAYNSKRDFSFLGGFLTIGLFTLIAFSLIGLFFGGFGGTLGLMIAAGGVLIFSGYILYDVSQYRHGLAEDMIPLAVLNLYLDFINLFLYLLRLLGILQDD